MSARAEFRAGWRNLAAATVGLGFGVPSYTAVSGLFFQAVRSEFGWSNTATAGALVALPITAAVLPLAGRLIDRLGVRIVSGVSVLLFALAFAWLSRLTGLREYYAALIALNVLGCATGPVAYTRLVAGQFVQARGLALAVAQFGIALIAAIIPPLLTTVIASAGWRTAYLALSASALCGGIAAQLLMQPRAAAARHGVIEPGLSVARAVRRRAFWLLGSAILLVSAASLGLVTQLQAVLLGRGVAQATGGWLLSLLALSVMVSRVGVGQVLDLGRPERWAALVLTVAAAGALVLAGAGTSLALLALGILLFGVSIGAELDLLAFFCARLFGMRNYSAIYGLLAVFFYVGLAAGGVGYGVVRDASGAYSMALLGSAGLFACSAVLFLLLGSESAKIAGFVEHETRG